MTDNIQSFEPVTKADVQTIVNVVGNIGAIVAGLNDVDINAGAGKIDKSNKCLWTRDGHRITVTLCSDGGVIASKSKSVDPEKPK